MMGIHWIVVLRSAVVMWVWARDLGLMGWSVSVGEGLMGIDTIKVVAHPVGPPNQDHSLSAQLRRPIQWAPLLGPFPPQVIP